MTTQKLIQQIKDTLEQSTNVKANFGEPIEEDGVTIIPVSSINVAGGGGGGQGSKDADGLDTGLEEDGESEGSGFGIGLQISARPMGFIKVKDNDATFEKITDTTKLSIFGIIGGVIVVLMALKLFKKKRK